ncbi:MAG: murein biosynthesis integral membrane protein MurJ [Candidatus Cloacimonetes bacterium]|nr:murein biosynthesis integral membrane protein MurJ [Candidatus Cloacimonadota bacterium]MDD4155141.1 murein biosynthesis integral membrane protein MurJ [Candidatus Cloacimonadota bacterium]
MKEGSSNVAKNSAIMSIAVFFSRILGLVRDQVMAALFGTSFVNDAFNIGFYIPNLLRKLFGEGALSAAFVPIYNEIGIKKGKRYQIDFAINVLSILSFILLFLTLLGIIFSPLIVQILYPGLSPETSDLASKLCRIMFPYLFLIGLSSTFIAILNSHNFFFITGLSSALLNVGWILLLIAGSVILKVLNTQTSMPNLVFYAAYGVMLGGFLQTIVNLPFLKKIGYSFKLILNFKSEAMKSLWYRFIPGMIGLGIREINMVADAIIASFLPIGSITTLGFGNRLMQLPLGIFGISIGTAVLPEYSKQFTEKRWEAISETLRFSIHYVLYIMLPITITMIMGSETFIRLIFQRGAFEEKAVMMTKSALIFYVIGLVFYGLNQTITPIFYAAKDTKTPVKIAAFIVIANITLNLILVQYMAHSGLAFATSITAGLQFLTMLIILKKKFTQLEFKGFIYNIIKVFAICIVLFIGLYLLNQLIFPYIMKIAFVSKLNPFIINLFKAIIILLTSITITLLSFNVFKPDYYKDIIQKLCKRFLKK